MLCVARGLTDIGRLRAENQDYFRIEENLGFFVVADGMGGLLYGARASRFAVDGLYNLIRGTLLLEEGPQEISALIKEAIIELSNILRERTAGNAGTTVVLALAMEVEAYIGHLGDSRAYLFRGGVLEPLTRDHNLARSLLERGWIASEEVRYHPARHELTAYVGMEGAIPEVKKVSLEVGDRLLLCTDGLWSMLSDQDMACILLERRDPDQALEGLIGEANEAGGYDNITAVLVDVVE